MKDWIAKLHGFLTLNNRSILHGSGSISHEEMLDKVEQEYQKHIDLQHNQEKLDLRISPDFDEAIRDIPKITS